jgi:protein phosphatase
MLNLNDNYTSYDENNIFELAVLSTIGDRKEQQDRVGYSIKDSEGIVVICDGMGGHQGGRLASTLAVKTFIEAYQSLNNNEDPQNFLFSVVWDLDKRVAQLKDSTGLKMQAGTTLSSVMIQQKKLYWVSVGDSRIYVFRNNEFVCITKDHTYKMLLDQKLSEGNISNEIYAQESKRGNVLVSFLGVDGLPYVERNSTPLSLLKNDIILIISDGIYKLLSDTEISNILKENTTVGNTIEALHFAAKEKSIEKRKSKDNISIAVIKIK